MEALEKSGLAQETTAGQHVDRALLYEHKHGEWEGGKGEREREHKKNRENAGEGRREGWSKKPEKRRKMR